MPSIKCCISTKSHVANLHLAGQLVLEHTILLHLTWTITNLHNCPDGKS